MSNNSNIRNGVNGSGNKVEAASPDRCPTEQQVGTGRHPTTATGNIESQELPGPKRLTRS